MTQQQIEALKLALETLKRTQNEGYNLPGIAIREAITALEEVLAEHAMREVQRLGQEIEQKIGCVNHDCDQCKAQPEQEPVAWMDKYGEIYKDVPEVLSTDKPLYTTPPQRKPLTDEEIERNWQFLYDEEGNPPDHHDFARAIEAEHGIKG
jgi:hypothetical protein